MLNVDVIQEISAKLDSVSALLKLLSAAAPYKRGDLQAAAFGIDELLSGAISQLDKTIMEAVQA